MLKVIERIGDFWRVKKAVTVSDVELITGVCGNEEKYLSQ